MGNWLRGAHRRCRRHVAWDGWPLRYRALLHGAMIMGYGWCVAPRHSPPRLSCGSRPLAKMKRAAARSAAMRRGQDGAVRAWSPLRGRLRMARCAPPAFSGCPPQPPLLRTRGGASRAWQCPQSDVWRVESGVMTLTVGAGSRRLLRSAVRLYIAHCVQHSVWYTV